MRSSKLPPATVSTSCRVEECDRDVEIPSRGLCRRCYQKWRSYGDPTVRLRDRDQGPECSVEGCSRPPRARRLCESHWRKAFPPDPNRPITDSVRASRDAYFWANVVQNDDGCWIWQRSTTGRGYGQMRGYRSAINTHRFAYELLVGPVPDGLEIDHLCNVPPCCNPGHLEPVTRPENLERSDRTRPGNGGRKR